MRAIVSAVGFAVHISSYIYIIYRCIYMHTHICRWSLAASGIIYFLNHVCKCRGKLTSLSLITSYQLFCMREIVWVCMSICTLAYMYDCESPYSNNTIVRNLSLSVRVADATILNSLLSTLSRWELRILRRCGFGL